MIAIIQYNAGNIGSVQNALQRLGAECEVTNDPQRIISADKVIFPGVGEASSAMESLRQSGLVDVITNLQQPVLGICLGLQLMCTSSEENDTTCLGIFDAAVKLFPPTDIIPHMGWNNCQNLSSKIFDGLTDADNFYFVHSYYAKLPPDVWPHATTYCHLQLHSIKIIFMLRSFIRKNLHLQGKNCYKIS